MTDGEGVHDCHRYGDYYACVIDDVREDDEAGAVELDVHVFDGASGTRTFVLSRTDRRLLRLLVDHDLGYESIDSLPGHRVLARPVNEGDRAGEWMLWEGDFPDEWRFRDDTTIADELGLERVQWVADRIPLPVLNAALLGACLLYLVMIASAVSSLTGLSVFASGGVLVAALLAVRVVLSRVGTQRLVDALLGA